MAIRKVAVLGAGHGGCAAAADLAHRGFGVSLYTRSRVRLEPIIQQGGLRMTGAAGEAFVPLPLVTDDLAAAVAGAEVLLVTVPLSAHPFYARALAPLVRPEQVIVLNPGHMGGGLYIAHEIYRLSGRYGLRLCEFATLTYGCRMKGPAWINIYLITRNLLFAAFPGKFQSQLYEAVKPLYPEIVPAKNILETGFLDINAIEHPPQILCNAGWVEHTAGEYLFYYEGTTPSVGQVIDAVDRERIAVAAAARVPTKPFVQYFYESGYTTAGAAQTGTAYAALQESAPNRWIKGPKNLDHRYVHEDVGWGLVPWSEIGRVLGVCTPVMDALITLASVMNEIDYRREGLTLAKMGLEGKDITSLERYLYEGIS
jgi:opine dehydrogenase